MYKKIHIKNAIYFVNHDVQNVPSFKTSLTATVKFQDNDERIMIRFLEGWRTNRKTNSEHSFDILTASNEDMIFSKRKIFLVFHQYLYNK